MAAQGKPQEVPQLLLAWNEGDESALEKLVPLVYNELRRLAKRQMGRERSDHSLQTTALINEAYLRLVDLLRNAKAMDMPGQSGGISNPLCSTGYVCT